MSTYTITVGAGTGANAGGYGYSDGSDGESAFGSISPGGSGVSFFVWAPDGSILVIGTATDNQVTWNGVDYAPTPDGSGGYTVVSTTPTGPFPTSGTTDFDISSPTYELSAGPGSFTHSGQSAALIRSRVLSAGARSFLLSGQGVAFARGYLGTITVGNLSGTLYGYSVSNAYGSIAWAGAPPVGAPTDVSWTSSGSSVQMTASRPARIFLNGESYTLTGSDGVYTRSGSGLGGPYPTSGTIDILFVPDTGWGLAAGAGALVLSGKDAGFSITTGYIVSAGAGTFALSGQVAGVLLLRRLAAGTASFAASGQPATLAKGTPLIFSAEGGAFALSGQPVSFGLNGNRTMLAGGGAFALTAQDAQIYWMDDMTVPWPESLPCQPEQGTWSETAAPDLASFQPESGPAIVRRRSTVRGTRVQSTWVLTAAQYQILIDWYWNDLAAGAERFALAHPVTGVAMEWTMEREPQMTATTNRRVRVQMQWRGLP